MGVTVHFEGKLKSEAAYFSLLQHVEAVASRKTWLTERFQHEEVTLHRVRDEQGWDYTGPTKGVVVYLHEDCDPLRLEFDRDLYLQDFVKTQFAGVSIHLDLIELLKGLQQFFELLTVEDEGEYWETGDGEALAQHIRRCDEVISEEATKNPAAQVKVKTPTGRIIDILRERLLSLLFASLPLSIRLALPNPALFGHFF